MKKNIYFYTNLFAWGLVIFLISNYAFGWTTPTANPPSANLPAPINVSSTAQSKVGYLAIGTSTAPTIPLMVIGNGYFSGNIGIGTTGPGAKLDVRGTNGSVALRTGPGYVNYDGYKLSGDYYTYQCLGGWDAYGSDAAAGIKLAIGGFRASQWDAVTLHTSGSERVRIDKSGNVGIGTTGPTSKLQVQGNVFIPSGYSYWIGNNADSGDRLRMHQTGTNSYIDYATGSLNIRAGTATKVTIDNNGNVGIGTTEPQQKLHINSAAGAVSGIQFTKSTDTGTTEDDGLQIAIAAANNDSYIIQKENADLYFRTNNQNQMIIKNTGNVGIGTTDPGTAKVKISGGVLDMTSQKITNLAAPTAASDAATKGYVDAASGGACYTNYGGTTCYSGFTKVLSGYTTLYTASYTTYWGSSTLACSSITHKAEQTGDRRAAGTSKYNYWTKLADEACCICCQ